MIALSVAGPPRIAAITTSTIISPWPRRSIRLNTGNRSSPTASRHTSVPTRYCGMKPPPLQATTPTNGARSSRLTLPMNGCVEKNDAMLP